MVLMLYRASAVMVGGILPIIFLASPMIWHWYSLGYILLANIFIWFLMIILFLSLLKGEKKYDIDYLPKYTVMVPVYNEDFDSLTDCIDSVVRAHGEKEIFIVDDGSTNGIWNHILALKVMYKEIKMIHRFSVNKSKRVAQEWMILNAQTDILVSIDSDEVFEKDAFIRLIAPLKDKSIGITTGQVTIKGEYTSILNRIQGILWWCANNIGRRSLGNYGIMACACGTSMAFRQRDILPILNEYVNQKHVGKRCTFGEDRHMTNLMLRTGKQVVYVENCISHADAKASYKDYLKQQLRWRRSMIRESIWALKNFAWGRSKILFIFILMNLVLPFMFLSILIPFIISIVLHLDTASLWYFILAVLAITVIRDIFMLYMDTRRAIGLIPFTIFNTFFIMPVWIYALYTQDQTGWETR